MHPLAGIAPWVAGALGGLSASALPARGVDVAFTEHVISTAANRPWTVFATDVDGDGDTDVLSASQAYNKVAWYENTTPPPIPTVSLWRLIVMSLLLLGAVTIYIARRPTRS